MVPYSFSSFSEEPSEVQNTTTARGGCQKDSPYRGWWHLGVLGRGCCVCSVLWPSELPQGAWTALSVSTCARRQVFINIFLSPCIYMRINSKCQARRNSCGAWLVIYSVIGLNEPRMYAPFPHLECVRRVVQLNHTAWKRVYSAWNRFPAYWREVNSLVLPLSLLLEIQAESRSWGVEFDVLSPSLCLCREAEQQLGRVHELKCLNWNLKATGVFIRGLWLAGLCHDNCLSSSSQLWVPGPFQLRLSTPKVVIRRVIILKTTCACLVLHQIHKASMWSADGTGKRLTWLSPWQTVAFRRGISWIPRFKENADGRSQGNTEQSWGRSWGKFAWIW